jgi:hypothetical protein
MARFNDKDLADLLATVSELKEAVNRLRNDFRVHDHGASDTYASFTCRVNTAANSITYGTVTHTAVGGAVPGSVKDLYT